MILGWIRIALQVLLVLCVIAVLWELRTAWRYQIAPALELAPAPLHASSEILISVSTTTHRSEFRHGRYGSAGYVASATVRDPDGLLRIVRGGGLFSSPRRGDPVGVAYFPAILPGAEPDPRAPNAPVEAEGTLLTFDILYGRALAFASLGAVLIVLLVGLGFFRVPMGAAADELGSPASTSLETPPPIEALGPAGSSAGELERTLERQRRGAALGRDLRNGIDDARSADRDPSD